MQNIEKSLLCSIISFQLVEDVYWEPAPPGYKKVQVWVRRDGVVYSVDEKIRTLLRKPRQSKVSSIEMLNSINLYSAMFSPVI